MIDRYLSVIKNKMGILNIMICLVLCGTGAECYGINTPDDIFGNMTYRVGNEYSSEKVTLVNGEYMCPKWLHVWYGKQYVYGDFNKDGEKDAAVIIIESGCGSGKWPVLAFLINDGDQLAHEQSYVLKDRTEVHSLKYDNGKVIIDMSIRGEEFWSEGHLTRIKRVYEYTGPDKWGPEPDFKLGTATN